ncbi:hypothetical protein ACIGCP_18505 [Cellulophaga baltica]|uniref:hypothetical protein n=1 Tax=Cellulophaga baltica TaxID=76594 RepID=UPI0037C5C020
MKRAIYFLLAFALLCNTCKEVVKEPVNITTEKEDGFRVFTAPSQLRNEYSNFNSVDAVNKIAEIENEYFNSYPTVGSIYYGTQWYADLEQRTIEKDSISVFQKYGLEKNNIKLDSMHCTIYAVKALESGFGAEFETIKERHKAIWSNREYAGWSLGYILTKFYHWKAYLIISKNSEEYISCLSNFKKDKKYHVWKQPNIPLEGVFDVDEDMSEIQQLLNANEFGWGFSDQGWHTWITRFDSLKECNWWGAPIKKYDEENNKPLFLKTKFSNYRDYYSHVVIFPPKINPENVMPTD